MKIEDLEFLEDDNKDDDACASNIKLNFIY